MTTFDLRALIDEVLAEGELYEPHDIAAEVAKRTPRQALRDAYVLVLADYVRIHAQVSTRHNPLLNGGSARSRPSSKTGLGDWWARQMADLVYADEWKPLGECTFDDLMVAAARRRELARQNAEAADRYEVLAKLLKDHDADTVRDLPPDVFAGVDDE